MLVAGAILAMTVAGCLGGAGLADQAHPSVSGTVEVDGPTEGITIQRQGDVISLAVSASAADRMLKVRGEIAVQYREGNALRQTSSAMLRIIQLAGQPPTLGIEMSGGAGSWAIGPRPGSGPLPTQPEGQRLLYIARNEKTGELHAIHLDIGEIAIRLK